MVPLLSNFGNHRPFFHGVIAFSQSHCTLESRIIGGGGIIGELDIVIIINNRGGLDGVEKIVYVLIC